MTDLNGGSAHPDPTRRLPVNPRRHRVPQEQRKRVQTACNPCNQRRIKCSGEKPCQQCVNGSRECQYPPSGEKTSVYKADYDALIARVEHQRRELDLLRTQLKLGQKTIEANAPPSPPTVNCPSPIAGDSPFSSKTITDVDMDEPLSVRAGRLLRDAHGTSRYHGQTSGATFLNGIKQFIKPVYEVLFPNSLVGVSFLNSQGRYQTDDSRPIETSSPISPDVVPDSVFMIPLFERLRELLQDGKYGAKFPCGGIYYWGDLDVASSSEMELVSETLPQPERENRASWLAFRNAALAVASVLVSGLPDDTFGPRGEVFYARAQELRGPGLHMTVFTTKHDLSTLALMGFYLAENNRRDLAYVCVSFAMKIAIVRGVHQGCVDDEAEKRTFWSVYILDRWLSCLMGRPPSIFDEAIKLELPEEHEGFPPPTGLRAHIELARISGYIVRNSYRVVQSPQTNDRPALYIDRARRSLDQWRQNLPPSLAMPDEDDLFAVEMDRPSCMLHMYHNQLLILAVRPLFFTAVRKAVGAILLQKRKFDIEDHRYAHHFRACGDAARRNLRLAERLRSADPGHKLLLADLHHLFNAAVIMMLHQISFQNLRTHDQISINLAIHVFREEAKSKGASGYVKDCLNVLVDLAHLVMPLRRRMFPSDAGNYSGLIPGEGVFMSLTPVNEFGSSNGGTSSSATGVFPPSRDGATAPSLTESSSVAGSSTASFSAPPSPVDFQTATNVFAMGELHAQLAETQYVLASWAEDDDQDPTELYNSHFAV